MNIGTWTLINLIALLILACLGAWNEHRINKLEQELDRLKMGFVDYSQFTGKELDVIIDAINAHADVLDRLEPNPPTKENDNNEIQKKTSSD